MTAELDFSLLYHNPQKGEQISSSRSSAEETCAAQTYMRCQFGKNTMDTRRNRCSILQHVAIAAAINIDRLVAWLDERPRAQTRTSRFAALAPAAALHPGEAAA